MATEFETAELEGERRQVTALFADLVGFTAFSGRSGEEAAFALMRRVAGMMTAGRNLSRVSRAKAKTARHGPAKKPSVSDQDQSDRETKSTAIIDAGA